MFRRLFSLPLVTALVVLAAGQAKADLLLEPYLGYEASQATFGTVAGDFKYNVTGTAIGARVGYAMPLLWFAADYSLGSLSSSVSSQPAGGTAESPAVSRQSLFVDVGVKIPLLQAYAGYGLINDWTFKGSTGDSTFKGSAIKVGAGFTGLPFVSLNVDYILSTFNKVKTPSGDFDINSSNNYKSGSASTIMLSVSAPFRL